MPDVIKFTTSKARVLPAPLAIVTSHPLYQKRTSTHLRLNRSKLVSVQFGHQGHRFVTMKYLHSPDGDMFLVGLQANLPSLLFGHNGRLVKNQDEMVLALTRARHVIEPFIHPDDLSMVLPGRDKNNTTFIKAVEIPIQLQDSTGEILNAANFTSCRNFVKTSQVHPGESILHRSSAMDIDFYDKLAEAGEGVSVPAGQGCTRIEVRFKSPRRIAEALRIRTGRFWAVASIPFDELEFAFEQVIKGSLIGALAEPKEKADHYVCSAARSILELAGDHVALLTALAEQERIKDKRAYGKIRRLVFHGLARLFPLSLLGILKTWRKELMSEVAIKGLEAGHQLMVARCAWPTEPAEDLADTFSGLLMVHSMDPRLKHFIRHSKENPF